jgi:DNA (cytosine-5)-methyltransferase 1
MNHGSLFSGIGGFDLASEWMGWNNVFHCEWNEFGQRVLKYYWPNAISYGDITKTDFTIHRGTIDILTGGFPCQDASLAKQDGEGQQGLRGKRTGLLYEFIRAISEIGPAFIVAENVANILKTNGGADFSTILTELSRLGYNAEWRVCRASEVGAPHHRARLYLVAYANSVRLQEGQTFFSHVCEKASQIPWSVNGASIQTFRGGDWKCEPPSICMDDGFSGKIFGLSSSQFRKEQIKAYGNAIVPQIAYQIFKAIDEFRPTYHS